MISKKTCLILGAGASRPYMLPTSRELRHIILGERWGKTAFEALGFNPPLTAVERYDAALLQATFSQGEINRFRGEFFNAQRVSIDAFLAWRKDEFEVIGKFATALGVLMCERRVYLNENWYQWLLEELIQDGPDFDASNLRVITFNYDRSFEFYFWRAFRATFNLNDSQADETLSRIEIVHVYGHCGELRSGVDVVPYSGNDGHADQAGRARKSINVVAPRTLPPTTERIREIIAESERLCFLGFGFWTDNLDLLGLSKTSKQIFASAFHLDEGIKRKVKSRLSPDFNKKMIFGESSQDVLAFVNNYDILG
jgi:hypothetical protein